MATAHDVAAYILAKQGSMSTMKLQKLVYYSQAWHLVWIEEPLFDERIEAWANGPVVKELFNAHRGRFNVADWPRGDAANLTKVQAGTVDAVLATYGDLTGRKLSYLTHSEGPWRNARRGYGPTDLCQVEITVEEMRDYYTYVADDDSATPVDEFDWGTLEDVPPVTSA
ncbi:Panacea domain-containing protein [Dactylosporangium sp. CA-152071]|uniref:Panacea domain-containing protein n=1 Tax=Dactylosporangium sp. CA-152071 TaxID=3239933 RepID=UPI003D9218C9